MATVFKPADPDQLREVVAWAAAGAASLEIFAGGSKADLGRPVWADHRLDVTGLTGITLYEPEELVMTAAAGTPLSEIEAELAAHGQELAFEPADFGPLLGRPAGGATIGGVFACNLSGPRRVKSGAARDYLLGVKGVSGRGDEFKTGGRVMKNVTGYDMCKLLAGSFGTLAVLTEVTFKVLPVPVRTHTMMVLGLDDGQALEAMTRAMQSPYEVYGAVHLPEPVAADSSIRDVAAAGEAVTAIRVEGPPPCIRYCCDRLAALLGDLGPVAELDTDASAAFWPKVRDVAPFIAAPGRHVWRASVPPAAGPAVVREISAALDVLHYYDWSGGLVWLAPAAGGGPSAAQSAARAIRAAVARAGGHALLVRAPEATRARVPVFQPQPAPLARLTARIKDSLDPGRVLNPGRMYEGV